MKLFQLHSYLPSGLRTLTQIDRFGFQSYLQTLEHLLFHSISKAYGEFDTFLPSTRDPHVLTAYLKTMGFDLPPHRPDILERCFALHRTYLERRGKKEGILLLCRILIDQEPLITDRINVRPFVAVGGRLTKSSHRLFPKGKSTALMVLTFSKELSMEDRLLLENYLSRDQPAGVRFLIQSNAIRRSVKRTDLHVGDRLIWGRRLCSA